MGLIIRINAAVYPTEDVEKIKNAIRLLFPDVQFEVAGNVLHGKSENIDEFGKIMKDMHIRDSARAVFLKHLKGNCVEFKLNKQVATVGKISFSVGDAPLGDITVEMCSPEIRSLIDEIAPDTRPQK